MDYQSRLQCVFRFAVLVCISGGTLTCSKEHFSQAGDRLKYVRTFRIPISDSTEFQTASFGYYWDSISKRDYFVNVNRAHKTLEFYDLDSTALFRVVELRGLSSPWDRLSGALIVNLDTIFVLMEGSQSILLTNVRGQLLNTWHLNELIPLASDSVTKYQAYCLATRPLLYRNGLLFIPIGAVLSVPQYYGKPTECMLDVRSPNPSVRLFAPFPADYSTSPDKGGWYSSATLDPTGQLVCAYQTDHHLYLFDQSSRIRKVQVQSHFMADTFVRQDARFEGRGAYYHRFEVEASFYEQVVYDQFRACYYRIATFGQLFTNPDSTKNQYMDKPWSIMVVDSSFHITDELQMEPRRYFYGNIIVVRGGILVSEDNLANKRSDKHYLTFSLFNLAGSK